MVQQGGKHQTQLVADGTERLAAENPHLEELHEVGEGGCLDLIVNLKYLDKIRSF